jgi:arabinose-5-phosphate isomerase
MNVHSRIKVVFDAIIHSLSKVEIDDRYDNAVKKILNTKGKVVTVGIGKAGYIAQKFAATLCSTCTPAIFLHPAEAAHGDLGVISPDDTIIAFSTSGKSAEVLETLELAQHMGVSSIIGVTSHPDSRLRELCELILDMGVVEEPCPIGLTPTASISVMLAIADGLALAVMEKRGVTKEDFGLRHHGGYLGRKARTDNKELK